LLALGLLWGSAYVAIREGIVAGASPFPFAGVRYAIVAALLGLAALVRREHLPDRRAILLSAVVGGTLIIGLYGMLLYWGEQFTSGGYASVLSGTGPLLTVVLAYGLLPAERLSRAAVLGVGIGFVGILVLVLPSLLAGVGGNWMGPVAITGAFVVFPLGTVLLRRWSRGPEGTWQLSVQFGVGAGVLGLAVLLAPGPERLPFTVGVWAAMAALVVFASLLGYVVYFRLHHRIRPGQPRGVSAAARGYRTRLGPVRRADHGVGGRGVRARGRWPISGLLLQRASRTVRDSTRGHLAPVRPGTSELTR